MRKTLVALALALAAAAAPALAQTSDPSPAQMDAAFALVDEMNMEVTIRESLDAMLRMQLEQNPQIRPYEQVMRDFFARYMSWEELRDDYARLYADSFTEAELREMAAFYRTPTGQKMARLTPSLMARAAKLGENAVQANLPELQRMLMDAMSAPSQ